MVLYGLLPQTKCSIQKMPWVSHSPLSMIENEYDPPLGEKRGFKLNRSNTCIVNNKLMKGRSIAKSELPGTLEWDSAHATRPKPWRFVYSYELVEIK